MYEVEVKVRAAHDPVREALRDLGATPQGTVSQVDTYYDAPHRDFAATDEALRLRRESRGDATTVELTYKGPRIETASKTRREIQSDVADGDAVDAILEALAFEPAATVEKERDRWTHGEYVISLDSVDGLGEFVEVETTASGDTDPAREGAYTLLRDLGLDPTDQITTSYLGLLLAE